MISVVVPAYNEGDGIRLLYLRLTTCAAAWREDYELLLVDDGSTDDTLAIAERLAHADPRFKVLSLSRNFGHQAAVTAGLEHALGDVVAILDADLQDPPEELARFIRACREGYDIVHGVRRKRKEGMFKRAGYKLFYHLLARAAEIDIPLDAGDFCVLNRRALDALNALPERNRFIRGLRSWVGLRQKGLTYERHARAMGTPKYTLSKLVNLAITGLVNFSSKPLRLIAVTGVLLGLVAVALALFVAVQYAADWTMLGYNPRQARGWTSLILAILFLASVQLVSMGIIGEYVGRLFEEIKRRPVYLVGRTMNMEPAARESQPHAPLGRRPRASAGERETHAITPPAA